MGWVIGKAGRGGRQIKDSPGAGQKEPKVHWLGTEN